MPDTREGGRIRPKESVQATLTARAASYLRRLCVEIPSRRVGSLGNQAATEMFAQAVASFGFLTECPEFGCVDWDQEGVRLVVGGDAFAALASPYSLGCRVRGPLVVVSTVDELEASNLTAAVLLMRGDIAQEQLMPKNFQFYNPDSHKRIIRLLEEKRPLAIITATAGNPELVGALNPFPLFEDGDFDTPSVYMTAEEGLRLASRAGEVVVLESWARRIPSTGSNVLARKGSGAAGRVVLFAHIDARIGTPGANDNASGVTVLLLLAELLAEYTGSLGVEIVAMNGEDYYACPGQMQYLARNAGRFGEIVLGINLDDVGYCQGNVAYSLYDCPADEANTIRAVFASHASLVEGEPWYQGDHGLFLMQHVPALALTTDRLTELMAEITHTPKDTPETVDPAKLAGSALALRDLVLRLDAHQA